MPSLDDASLEDLYRYLGMGLQVGGLIAAGWLLVRLREHITGRGAWPRTAWRRMASWLRRLWARVRRRPVNAIVRAGGAHGSVSVSGTARATKMTGAMPNGLTVAQQISWLDQFVRDLEDRHNDLHAEVGRESAERNRAVREVRNAMREAVEDVRREFRELIGRDVGWEILALGAIAVGVVFTSIPDELADFTRWAVPW
jgi:hypothetical protein